MNNQGFYCKLGRSGLSVSRLCFGTLPMGPIQANLPLDEGMELLAEAFFEGITFWDTAELYDNYHYLRQAIKRIKTLPVIATKTYAYSAEGARGSLEKARRELDLDIIPIFLLHEQESALTLKGHEPALDFLLNSKEKGLIQAVGISCHTIAAIKAAIDFKGIDVIHPLVNYKGIGIKDGSLAQMLEAASQAEKEGIGLYAMKILGGGHLIQEACKAIEFVRELDFIHSYAIGMTSIYEVQANLAMINGRDVPDDLKNKITRKQRNIIVESWCSGCGLCVEQCPQKALQLDEIGLHAVVDKSRCIFCGYCGAYCLDFCIKIF